MERQRSSLVFERGFRVTLGEILKPSADTFDRVVVSTRFGTGALRIAPFKPVDPGQVEK